MSLVRWKKLRLVKEIKNRWWTYRMDQFELPSGKIGEYHYVHTSGSSLTIPVLDNGSIVLVRQYRYLCNRDSLEFPCGSVKDGSSYEETARLELAEKTGFAAQHFEEIGTFNLYNGITDELCRVYLAAKFSPTDSKPDETEQFERVFVTPHEIDNMVDAGEIWDGMSLAAWLTADKRIEK